MAHDINSFFSSVLIFSFWNAKFLQVSLREASSKTLQGHNLILFYLHVFASFICIRRSFLVVHQGCDSFSCVLQDSCWNTSSILSLAFSSAFVLPLSFAVYYSILVSVGALKRFPFKNEIIKTTNFMIMRYFNP